MFKFIAALLVMVVLSLMLWSGQGGRSALALGPTATLPASAARANDLNLRGQQLYHDGHYTEAIAAWEEALTIVRSMGSLQNQGVLLSNIGAAYEAQGQFVKALDEDAQALAIAKQTHNSLGQAQTLNNLGNLYEEQGQYAKALDSFNQSLALLKQVGDRVDQGVVQNSMGNVLRDQGQFAKAQDIYNQALAIARQAGDRVDQGLEIGNLGVIAQELGQYAKALDDYNQALTIARQLGDRDGEARTLSNLGALHAEEGQYDQALPLLTQALAARRDLQDLVGEAETLSLIGTVYSEQGQYTQALDIYTQALPIARKIPSAVDEAVLLEAIGLIYKKQAIYSTAIDNYNQALDLRRQIGDQAGIGDSLASLAGVYGEQGALPKALDLYTQALAIHRATGSRRSEFDTLSNLGDLYETLDRRADAIASYRAAVDVLETILNNAELQSTIASLLDQPNVAFPYQRLTAMLIQDGQLPEAVSFAERGRALLSRAAIAGKAISTRASSDQTLLQRETDLRLTLDSAQKTLDSLHKDVSASAADIQNAQDALEKARTDYQSNLEAMQVHGGLASQQLSGAVASVSQIQAAIPADTTFVLYSLDEKNSVAFLITKNTLDAVTLNAPDTAVTELVKTFAVDRRANADALAKLYDLLISPLASKLNAKHLIIAPDGVLNYVPFAALSNASGHALIDDYSVSVVPSATTLVLLENRQSEKRATSPGLVLAQPAAPGLTLLAHARSEASNVAKVLGVTPILNASINDLLQKAAGSKVVHISAHTELDARHPLFSAIYLKGDSQNEGRVDVRGIYGLDLTKGTELVVLSGCNTAVGGTGEDFGALTQAFFAAGTQRVVASLWSVDDESTALLMSTYFSERAKGSSDTEALRAAMIATRDKFPDPYFWAGFVLSGLP